jgi:hypothetical protein
VRRRVEGVDRLIDTLRTEIRYRILLTAFTGAAGVAIVALGVLLSGSLIPEALKWSFTVGGACVSSLIGFPLRDVFARKRKVLLLSLLRGDYQDLDAAEPAAVDDRISAIDDRFFGLAQ